MTNGIKTSLISRIHSNKFLTEYGINPNMAFKDIVREYNEQKYPNPMYVGLNELLDIYENQYGAKVLDWKKVKRNVDNNLIKPKKALFTKANNRLFNPDDPKQKGLETYEGYLYPAEHFKILVEAKLDLEYKLKPNKLVNDVRIDLKRKYTIRNFNKLDTQATELEIMTEMMETYLASLAKKSILENASKLSEEAKKELYKFLIGIIPD